MQTQREHVRLLAALLLVAACTLDNDPVRGPIPGPDPGSPGLSGRGGKIPGVDPVPRLIEVTATEYDFSPNQIRAEPGEQIVIALRNTGRTPQNIEFMVDGERYTFAEDVAPGETRELRITIPVNPGGHEFYCPIGDRRERGMQGSLLVMRPPTVRLEHVASGLVSPIAMTVAEADPAARRFVVDQIGLVRVLTARDELLAEPFLDLRDRILPLDSSYDERGLLGLAFHPDFARNGRLFVFYTAKLRDGAPSGYDHTSYVSEFTAVPPGASRVEPATERVILAIDQPQAIHNGGTLAFGPRDHKLYVGVGDGGGRDKVGATREGDPPSPGQDMRSWLGTILRIDVDAPGRYALFTAPADNPLTDLGASREIFAYGFRNPFGLSFDHGGRHELFVPEAGEALWQEVNVVEAGGNYGAGIREGTHCFDPDQPLRASASCATSGPRGEPLAPPVIEFPSTALSGGLGASVIGGYVYRGEAIPELHGRYVFGSYGRSTTEPFAMLLSASDHDTSRSDPWPIERVAPEGEGKYYVEHFLKGFGRDERGELYLLVSDEPGPSGATGRVVRLEAPID